MAVFLFVDESGDFDFGQSGSRFFLFGVLSTRRPATFEAVLTKLRYELLEEGHEIECFHATDDRQIVRDRVFAVLGDAAPFDLDFLIVEKQSVPEPWRDPARFYPRLGHVLIQRVLARYASDDERIVVVTDRIPIKRQRNAVEKAFKTSIRQTLGDRTFSIVHHASSAHAALQAVDYCVWAVQRKLRNGDGRSYQLIAEWIRSELKEEM
jgi:uncharacterized protein DUF3800